MSFTEIRTFFIVLTKRKNNLDLSKQFAFLTTFVIFSVITRCCNGTQHQCSMKYVLHCRNNLISYTWNIVECTGLYGCDYKEWQGQVDTQHTPTVFENQSNYFTTTTTVFVATSTCCYRHPKVRLNLIRINI